MTTTEAPKVTTRYSENRIAGRVVAIVELDGKRLGHVVCKGRTFTASRKTGTSDDMRRIGNGFRSAEAAADWVAKSAN